MSQDSGAREAEPPQRLVVLCGPAFAGKSRVADLLRRLRGAAVVALDELNARRGLASGEGLSREEWARTHAWALGVADALLREGRKLVVIDDTSCFRFLREDYRRLAARRGVELRLVVLATPEAEIRRRIAANRHDQERPGLDPDVLETHLATFEWPAADEDPVVIRPEDDPQRRLVEIGL